MAGWGTMPSQRVAVKEYIVLTPQIHIITKKEEVI
jgi:hypothetical protein